MTEQRRVEDPSTLMDQTEMDNSELHLSPFESLPPDAVDSILSCLTLEDYRNVSRVSRRMREAVSLSSHLHMSEEASLTPRFHSRAFQSLAMQPKKNARKVGSRHPRDDLRRLLRRFSNLNVVHLQGLASVGDDIVSIINESPSASSITSISLQGCALSYWCRQPLQLKSLRHVSISAGSIRSQISALLTKSPGLISLRIVQCSALRDSNVKDVGSLVRSTLRTLTLKQCVRLRRPSLQFPRLTRLNMAGCFGL